MSKGNGRKPNTKSARSKHREIERSPYPRHIIDEAKRLWLAGYSPERVARLSHMPNDPHTIRRWEKKEGWRSLADKAMKKANGKLVTKIANSLADMDDQQMELLGDMREQIRVHMGFDILDPKDIKALTDALDKVVRNERLIRGEATERAEDTVDVTMSWKDIIFNAAERSFPDETGNGQGVRSIPEQLPEQSEPLGK